MNRNFNVGGINQEISYQISEEARIEIATGSFWGNRIRYVSDVLWKMSKPDIEKIKVNKRQRLKQLKKIDIIVPLLISKQTSICYLSII